MRSELDPAVSSLALGPGGRVCGHRLSVRIFHRLLSAPDPLSRGRCTRSTSTPCWHSLSGCLSLAAAGMPPDWRAHLLWDLDRIAAGRASEAGGYRPLAPSVWTGVVSLASAVKAISMRPPTSKACPGCEAKSKRGIEHGAYTWHPKTAGIYKEAPAGGHPSSTVINVST
jgi:hypothetical protein